MCLVRLGGRGGRGVLVRVPGGVGRFRCVAGCARRLRCVIGAVLDSVIGVVIASMTGEAGGLRSVVGEAGRLRRMTEPSGLRCVAAARRLVRRVRLLRQGSGRRLLRGVCALVRCVCGGRSGEPLLPVPVALLVFLRVARPGLLLPRRVLWGLLPPRLARRLCRPRRGRAARERGRRVAAPLLDQGRRGELARLVRKVAPGDGDGPLPGHVMAGRGVSRRDLLEVPLPGGSRVVREPVVPAVLPRPGVGSVGRVGSVRLLTDLVALLPVRRVRVVRVVRIVPLGAVDGRAGRRPRARGGRVGAGGRGGVDRYLRRYVAVAGRG